MTEKQRQQESEDRNGYGRRSRELLLFVDQDELLIEMIRSGLALSRPGWGVVAATDPSEALDILELRSEFVAVLTELDFDQSRETGRRFIHEVAEKWPEIPIFVMSGLDAESAHGLETTEFIAKPPDMDFLIARIDRAIRRQRESLVRGIALPSFLQILEIDRKTCTVMVSYRGRVGILYFRDGRLMQARLGELEGKEALFEMLSMAEHSLRVIDSCDADKRINSTLTSLLMEWSVREDHARRRRSAAAGSEENG